LHAGVSENSAEASLVKLARKGDSEAFGQLVRRRQSWLRNLMRRLCGDPVLADDLSQQAFLQAWRALPALHEADHFGAWLKRLAVNTWLQHLRRTDVMEEAAELDEHTGAPPDETTMRMDLDRALSSLPEIVRLCIVLSYHERMTHPEIAELSGLPVGTVKSHIRRGTERLRAQLGIYRPHQDGRPDDDR
jgi:RNA polymerase sigma-70 factor (ECF subfamily)